MALTDTELNDILSALSPDEQRQLLNRLQENLAPAPVQQTTAQPKMTNTGKVYACIHCGSVNYKKHGFTNQGMQRYRCREITLDTKGQFTTRL